MATFSLPAMAITANVLKVSPSAKAGTKFNGVSMQLSDPSGDWPARIDNTRHLKMWGFQQSFDDGTTWEWGPVFVGSPDGNPDNRFGPDGVDYWTPFGQRNRAGGMPGMAISSSDLVGQGTTRLRLAVITDANVRLGALITTE